MKNHAFKHRLSFAIQGVRAAWHFERSFRIQGYFTLALLPLMLILQPKIVWWALVGVMAALVLAAELLNTALEHFADRMHPGHHPAIKLVKDCSAAAVLVLSIGALWVAFCMVIDTLLW